MVPGCNLGGPFSLPSGIFFKKNQLSVLSTYIEVLAQAHSCHLVNYSYRWAIMLMFVVLFLLYETENLLNVGLFFE